MEGILLTVMAISNAVCFVIGAKVAQTVIRGKEIRMPSANPLEAVRARREKQEARTEQSRLDAILRNIEVYDGTGRGQEDIPGR